MREAIERLAARYGQVLTVYQDEQAHTVRAFLQPDPSRDEQVPDGMSSIGYLDGRRWIYLGTLPLSPGDRVEWENAAFRVRSSWAYAVGIPPRRLWPWAPPREPPWDFATTWASSMTRSRAP